MKTFSLTSVLLALVASVIAMQEELDKRQLVTITCAPNDFVFCEPGGRVLCEDGTWHNC
ncbi:hypothetical protein Slin15195_G052660 [Septoria linicola]|uniref:Uncharacterized protein n=1 Tax=Septoria linicola TaxID=215465 RepID=A0A9Q9EJA2_9PEZI|nr:hypothetical protein Slin14017_G128130 [Septoria linicola]USW51947.1 hypothetical protein Slin15195_G052660 [Septoria linicola]